MRRNIVIIGGGPGGYTAAKMARRSGFSTVLIEMDALGGTCLNRGCIPTKTLFNEAETIEHMISASEHGINLDGFQIDTSIMAVRKKIVIEKLRNEIEMFMENSKVDVIKGIGIIQDKNHVLVRAFNGDETIIETDYIVIATGSRPEKPDVPGINLEGVITCEEILNLDRSMNDVVIIGGGVIGVEMASILSLLKISVTIVESRDDILYNIDDDIRDKLYEYMKKRGINIYKSCSIKKIYKEKHNLRLSISSGDKDFNLYGDTVMVSSGRVPVTSNLNLDSIGIKYDGNGIKVDSNLRTNIDNIFAVGDVTGGMMLAHVAFHQGKKVINNIKGQQDQIDYEKVPYSIYTFPEIAGVGLTEKKAVEKSMRYKVGYSSFLGCGRAVAMGETDGFVKIICDENETIVGVHILGPHASDVIHEGALAVNSRLKVHDITSCIHAHPTLSECLYEAACSVKNKT